MPKLLLKEGDVFHGIVSTKEAHWGPGQAGLSLFEEGIFHVYNNIPIYQERDGYIGSNGGPYYPTHRALGGYPAIYSFGYDTNKPAGIIWLYPGTYKYVHLIKDALRNMIGQYGMTEQTKVMLNATDKVLFTLGDLKMAHLLIRKNREQRSVTDSEYWDTYQKQGWKIVTKSTPILTTPHVTGPQTLTQKAKKYMRVEEFVKAQGTPIFRGGKELLDKKVTKSGISFSLSKEVSEDFVKQKGGEVSEYILSPKSKIIDYKDIPNVKFKNLTDYSSDLDVGDKQIWKDLEIEYQKAVNWAKQNKYDAVKLPLEGEIRIINPSQIKTKAQLTDIWKQAQANPELTSLEQKMLKELRENPDQLKNVLEIPGAWSIQWINAAEKVKAERANTTNIEVPMKKTLEELNPKPELIARAKQAFPPTYNALEAGFVLEDGTFLDFSGKSEGGSPEVRVYEHRDISQIIDKGQHKLGPVFGLALFLKQTNAIKFDHYPHEGGTNVTLFTYNNPTSSQLEVIRRVISENPGTPLAFTAYDKDSNRVMDEFIKNPQPYTLTRLVEKFDELKAKESAKMIPKDPHERHKEIKAQLEQITKEGGEAFRRKDTAKIRELHKLSKQLEDEQKKLAPTLLKHAWEVMKKEDQKPKERTFPFYKVGLETKTEHSVLTEDFYSPEAAIEAAKKHLREYPRWDTAKAVEFDGIGRKVIRTIKQQIRPIKQKWQMTKSEFIEDYYKTDKAKRVIWRGRDYTKKTAQIATRKLGTEYSVEDSPYEKGRFIVVRYKTKLPLEEYKIKHGASLSNIHKQAINRAISEGKQIPNEVLRDYPELSLTTPKQWQPTLKGEISLLP